MILAGGMYYRLYKTSAVLLLPSCWLWGRWGPLNAIPRTLLPSMERPAGPTCWFGLTQKQQTGKNHCSAKGNQFSMKQQLKTQNVRFFQRSAWGTDSAQEQTVGSKHAAGSTPRLQCSFLPERSLVRGLNSTWLSHTKSDANMAL